MNHWAFVTAAYAATFIGTTAVLVLTYLSMRRAEAAAESLKARK